MIFEENFEKKFSCFTQRELNEARNNISTFVGMTSRATTSLCCAKSTALFKPTYPVPAMVIFIILNYIQKTKLALNIKIIFSPEFLREGKAQLLL
jgi:UDP-glucose 6-dehydrogenase